MTPHLKLQPPRAEALAPFATLIAPPTGAEPRAFYSQHLADGPDGAALQVHVNTVLSSALPLQISKVERHPFAAQAFVPLDVARYIVAVFPSSPEGEPIMGEASAFLVPGTLGVIFAPGVWHLGATVLDRTGHFVVMMRRRNDEHDDVFLQVRDGPVITE